MQIKKYCNVYFTAHISFKLCPLCAHDTTVKRCELCAPKRCMRAEYTYYSILTPSYDTHRTIDTAPQNTQSEKWSPSPILFLFGTSTVTCPGGGKGI